MKIRSMKQLLRQTAEAAFRKGFQQAESQIVYGLKTVAKLNGSGAAVLKAFDPAKHPHGEHGYFASKAKEVAEDEEADDDTDVDEPEEADEPETEESRLWDAYQALKAKHGEEHPETVAASDAWYAAHSGEEAEPDDEPEIEDVEEPAEEPEADEPDEPDDEPQTDEERLYEQFQALQASKGDMHPETIAAKDAWYKAYSGEGDEEPESEPEFDDDTDDEVERTSFVNDDHEAEHAALLEQFRKAAAELANKHKASKGVRKSLSASQHAHLQKRSGHALLDVILELQERANAEGDPTKYAEAQHELAALAADHRMVRSITHGGGLRFHKSWTAYEGPRGGKGFKNDETGRIVYRATKPGEKREAAQANKKKAADLVGKIRWGEGHEVHEHLRELVDHLPAMDAASLRNARAMIGAKFGGKSKDKEREAIKAHAMGVMDQSKAESAQLKAKAEQKAKTAKDRGKRLKDANAERYHGGKDTVSYWVATNGKIDPDDQEFRNHFGGGKNAAMNAVKEWGLSRGLFRKRGEGGLGGGFDQMAESAVAAGVITPKDSENATNALARALQERAKTDIGKEDSADAMEKEHHLKEYRGELLDYIESQRDIKGDEWYNSQLSKTNDELDHLESLHGQQFRDAFHEHAKANHPSLYEALGTLQEDAAREHEESRFAESGGSLADDGHEEVGDSSFDFGNDEPEPSHEPGTDLFGNTVRTSFTKPKPKQQATLEDMESSVWVDKANDFAAERGGKVEKQNARGQFKTGGQWYEVGRAEDGHPVTPIESQDPQPAPSPDDSEVIAAENAAKEAATKAKSAYTSGSFAELSAAATGAYNAKKKAAELREAQSKHPSPSRYYVPENPHEMTAKQFRDATQKPEGDAMGAKWVTHVLGKSPGKPGLTLEDDPEYHSGEMKYRDDKGNTVGVVKYSGDNVTDVVVHPDYQRQGIARKMMDELKKQKGITKIVGPFTDDGSAFAHRSAVESALSSGKSVPAEVLADYPDLQAKYGSKPTPPPMQWADDTETTAKVAEPSANLPEVTGGGSTGTERQNKPTAPGVSHGDIPLGLATQAHRGTSFVPEKRGKQHQEDYVSQMNQDYEYLSKYAKTDEEKQQMLDEFARYKDGYRSKYMDMLRAKSRVMSPMITGPARFPVRSNEKKGDTERRRYEDVVNFRENALNAIRKKFKAGRVGLPIQSNDPEAVTTLQTKLEQSQKLQEAMRQANTVIRGHMKKTPGTMNGRDYTPTSYAYKPGKSESTVIDELKSIGLSEETARRILKPDFAGRIGFADYELTNNNAKIKQVQDRLASIQKLKATPSSTDEYTGGVKVSRDPEAARIRLHFPGKPERDTIQKLKSAGFRWSPSESAWQRHLNNAGEYAVESMLKTLGHTKQASTTAAPEPEQEEPIPAPVVIQEDDEQK